MNQTITRLHKTKKRRDTLASHRSLPTNSYNGVVNSALGEGLELVLQSTLQMGLR